jgi:hypothetical protein
MAATASTSILGSYNRTPTLDEVADHYQRDENVGVLRRALTQTVAAFADGA